MNVPNWWLNLSGAFFALALITFIAFLVIAIQLAITLSEVAKSIRQMSARLDGISTQVEGLVKTVRKVTGDVGSQASQIAQTANIITSGLSQKAELAGTVLLSVMALRRLFKR